MNPLSALSGISSARLIGYALIALSVVAGVLWLEHRGAQACEAKVAQTEAQRAEQQAQAVAEAQRIEQQRADRVQEIQDAKDRQLRAVSAQLADALERLRNRPQRLPETSRAACSGATGAELSGPDAGFLVREAARADELRAALDACQKREAVR